MKDTMRGFTLIELMIGLLVLGIAISLAVPSFQTMVEKRRLTAAAEDIQSHVAAAQSLAIKLNRPVNVSWKSTGSHSEDFCMGLSSAPNDMPCDCRETDPSESDFCAVDGMPYRLTKIDFVDIDYEFMHFRPAVGDFGFDPVRGAVDEWSDTEIFDNDWLIYLHSNEGTGSSRLFGLEIYLAVTGRMSICNQSYRQMDIGAYTAC